MKVNGLVFLTTISRNIYYRTASYMPQQTADQYKDELKQIVRYYNKAGLRIECIHADNEFRPLLEPMQDEFESSLILRTQAIMCLRPNAIIE